MKAGTKNSHMFFTQSTNVRIYVYQYSETEEDPGAPKLILVHTSSY